jgi:Fe2+ transport system protein FeoA
MVFTNVQKGEIDMSKTTMETLKTAGGLSTAGPRLADAGAGERLQITKLVDVADVETLQKMILMGALPGKRVEIIQRFPAFLIGLGNSQFAIDRELAEKIVVQPLTA